MSVKLAQTFYTAAGKGVQQKTENAVELESAAQDCVNGKMDAWTMMILI